jgi:hypothetical protein
MTIVIIKILKYRPLINKSLYKLCVDQMSVVSFSDFEPDQKNCSNDMKRYEMKPRSSKRPISRPNQFKQIFNKKCADTLAELAELEGILQKLARDYCLFQHSTECQGNL